MNVLETQSTGTRAITPLQRNEQIGTRPRSSIRLKSILVPIDFSAPSESALDQAVRVANRFDSNITLVHVVASADTKGNRFRLAFQRVGAEQELRLKRLVRDKGIDPKLLEQSIVLQGHPFIQITALARSLRTDLIVIATHGYTGLKHFMLGSTTEKVVRYAPCPVLVARNHLREKAALRLRNVLVPLDFSERSLSALRYAGAFAREFGATETLLHVVHPVYYFTGADFDAVTYGKLWDDLEAIGEARMRQLFKELKGTGLKVQTAIRRGHPPTEVLEQAVKDKSDLIVLSTHGWTGFKHAFLGSVSENVVRLAPCDVLVVRRVEHEFV